MLLCITMRGSLWSSECQSPRVSSPSQKTRELSKRLIARRSKSIGSSYNFAVLHHFS